MLEAVPERVQATERIQQKSDKISSNIYIYILVLIISSEHEMPTDV